MKLIIKLDDFGLTTPAAGADSCTIMQAHEEVEETIRDHINADYPSVDKYSSMTLLFGSIDAAGLVEEVKKWNDEIRTRLFRCMERFVKAGCAGLELDTQETHNLSLLARAADDMFTPYGDYGVLRANDMGFGYLSTVIPAEIEDDVLKNPQKYAIATFCVY